MDNFPATPDLILAVFTSLLSLVVSLLLIKIQRSNSETVSKIIDEQKLLQINRSGISDLAKSKITTVNETKSAREFLEKDASKNLNEIRDELILFGNQLPKLYVLTLVGMLFMFPVLGFTSYVIYTVITNGGVIHFSTLVTVMVITAIALVYFGVETYYVKRFSRKYEVLKRRKDYVISEIEKAVELVGKIKTM